MNKTNNNISLAEPDILLLEKKYHAAIKNGESFAQVKIIYEQMKQLRSRMYLSSLQEQEISLAKSA